MHLRATHIGAVPVSLTRRMGMVRGVIGTRWVGRRASSGKAPMVEECAAATAPSTDTRLRLQHPTDQDPPSSSGSMICDSRSELILNTRMATETIMMVRCWQTGVISSVMAMASSTAQTSRSGPTTSTMESGDRTSGRVKATATTTTKTST